MPEGERSEIGGGEEVLAAAVVVVAAAGFGVEVEIGSGGPEKERSGGGAKNPTWRILGSLTVREARRGSIRLGILVFFFGWGAEAWFFVWVAGKMVWAYEGKYEGFLGNLFKIFVESFGVWIVIAIGRGFY